VPKLTASRVVRDAGGGQALARHLGAPVNEYTVSIWVRNGTIPARHHWKISRLINCDMADLSWDDADEKRPKHRAVGHAYAGLIHAVGVRSRKAAKLHQVEVDQVERWLAGRDEVPPSAFMDIYAYASGRIRMRTNLTVETAMKMTGLSQRGLCKLLNLSAPNATYWKAAGKIPPHQAARILELSGEGKVLSDFSGGIAGLDEG